MTDVAGDRSTRIKRFLAVWIMLGVLGSLPAGFASLIVWMALDQPTHCGYQAPCSANAILSHGRASLGWVWGLWFGAGVIAWLIGQRAAAKNSRFGSAPALIGGALVFGIGLFAAGWTLAHGIDATHGP
ncbi:hypothetical protein ACWEP5_30195 [Nocardia niigatensis]